ncbi:hypothetical protein EMQ_2177 [Acetobacter aceti NBRC 14818]|uniref:Transposase n=1 Tax=Acetobacter aceti NBRC 14818 TaxID=887700 RepID=A0AB33IFJ1_ACEAC|nr:hypothetical protein EMQ_2177 [Acetobacter aceti NBRC 14818]GAN58594.1 hypothetical protein Abac_058_057 [Acetobacter aceti NBRC 14818]
MGTDVKDLIAQETSHHRHGKQRGHILIQDGDTRPDTKQQYGYENNEPGRKQNNTPVLSLIKIHLIIREKTVMVTRMSFIKKKGGRVFSMPKTFVNIIFTDIKEQNTKDKSQTINQFEIMYF